MQDDSTSSGALRRTRSIPASRHSNVTHGFIRPVEKSFGPAHYVDDTKKFLIYASRKYPGELLLGEGDFLEMK